MNRQPRQHNDKHLDFIRSLSCVVCGDPHCTEAAHVRFAEPKVGKRQVGMGEKPDDEWTVPLCGSCHRQQHTGGEKRFWKQVGVDPILLSLALARVSGDVERGEQIVSAWRERRAA